MNSEIIEEDNSDDIYKRKISNTRTKSQRFNKEDKSTILLESNLNTGLGEEEIPIQILEKLKKSANVTPKNEYTKRRLLNSNYF